MTVKSANILLLFVFMLTCCPAAGAAKPDDYSSMEIFDLNDTAGYSLKDRGYTFSQEHTRDGRNYSIYWNHDTCLSEFGNCRMEFYSVPTDFAPYEVMDLSIYGENCSNSKFVLVLVCSDDLGYFRTTITMKEGQNEFSIPLATFTKSKATADWSKISYIWFSASGWAMNPTSGGEFWLNSVIVRTQLDTLEDLYRYSDLKTVYSALEHGVAVYANSKNVVQGSKVYEYMESGYQNEVVTVPVSLFSDYLGAETEEGEIRANGRVLSVAADTRDYSINGVSGTFSTAVYWAQGSLYVPAAEAAELLGYQAMREKKLVVMGDEMIFQLSSGKKDNVLTEIAAYLAYHTDVDPNEITKEDMAVVKDRWQAYLVGEDGEDFTGSMYQTALRQIQNNAATALEAYRTAVSEGRTDSLFLEREPSASSDMSLEYNQIFHMAKAWAQRGQSLYQSEELLGAILGSLQWMYENRFGQDEIENNENAWRDHTLTNWYDWQIASPQYLVDIMMLVEGYLTPEQKENYLAMFEHYLYEHCYSSMFSDAGMNVLYTVECWIGAAILQSDASQALEAVSALHNCFSWADSFPTGEGFYTDGSCLFHYKHAMTGTYGAGQFSKSGMILSVLRDTKLDFTNPRRENVFDWVFDAFEPLIYEGDVFHMVMGRSDGSGHYVTRNIVKGMLDLLEFAQGETLAKMKSLIKYIVTLEKAGGRVSYNDTAFSLPQIKKLNEILNDSAVAPREDYFISKVYASMDKTVHQRGKWAFGISMSSSRTYDYECIHGENTTGWYTGEGMTQLMLANDPYQFHSDYWTKIDPYKYPGTTVDNQKRTAHTIDTGQAFVKDYDDVGGVSLKGEYSVSAQHLNAFHLDKEIVQSTGNVIHPHTSTLTARKAWFCFDNEVVCLGSAVNANDGYEVLTVVENRKPTGSITSDGYILSLSEEETDLSGNSWVHIENTAGYFFPEGGRVRARQTEEEVSFFQLWLSHGINPVNQGYSYVILPAMTAEETAEYAENPGISILCNTDEVQAVADKSTGAVGIVFHKAGSLGGITVSQPMALMLREKDGILEISAADTTHKLTNAEIFLDRALGDMGKTNGRMRLSEDGKTVSIDFMDANGASIESEFAIASFEQSVFVGSFGFPGDALQAEITNDSLRFFDCRLTLGGYSEKKELIHVKTTKISVAPLTRGVYIQQPAGAANRYKGFLWDNAAPITAAVESSGAEKKK